MLTQNTDTNVESKSLYTPIKIFACFTCLVGCVALGIMPFYLPLLKFLGVVGTITGSASCLAVFTYISYNGFSFINSQKQAQTPLFMLSCIYMVSITFQIVAIVLSLRILNAGASFFFDTKLQYVTLPER